MARKYETEEAIDFEHPSQEKKERHPTDMALRAYGFRIYSRAKGCEAEWIMGGLIYPQSEAVEIMAASEKGR